MGSFRLTAGSVHLDTQFNFAESTLETAGRSLRHSCRSELRTVIVTAAVYWDFNSELAPLLLIFQHRAGVRLYTSPYGFAQPCVLSKQSPPPSLCPPPIVAY